MNIVSDRNLGFGSISFDSSRTDRYNLVAFFEQKLVIILTFVPPTGTILNNSAESKYIDKHDCYDISRPTLIGLGFD